MPPRLAHLAVIVRDASSPASLPVGALGLKERDRDEVPAEGATVSFIPVGEADLELVQPAGPGGALVRFLESRGEAVHHLALRVESIEAATARAVRAGLRLAGEAPRTGAFGAKIAWVHPSSLCGVLVEFIEARKTGKEGA